MASTQGFPYFARISFSIEPELMPIRIGIFFNLHASTTCFI